MKAKSSFILILLITISCRNKDVNLNDRSSDRLVLTDTVGEYSVEFEYDSTQSIFSLHFTDSAQINPSDYRFDKFGKLEVKSCSNFWGEKEKYFFDVNGTLKEYRKLVNLTNNKIGLQEFIRYRNGIIDDEKSHYFDFNIIDSSEMEYKVELKYLGGFQLDSLSIYVDDFAHNIKEMKSIEPLLKSSQRSVNFWVDKIKIWDKEFDFFQLNLRVRFGNSGSAIQLSDQHVSNFPYTQAIILRKFKENTI